jgi:superfamily II DNA/RNA helicase
VGTIKEERLNAVVNAFAPEHNAKMQRLEEIIDGKQYQDDQPRNLAKKGDRAPGVVFAHNLKTVDAIKTSLEKKGMRVGVIRGDMSGKDKERVKVGFNPPNPSERKYDVIVLSDAGATGLNLQNAKYLVNFDLPQTAWVKKQREGRIDRHGQVHAEIDYHDLVTDTPHEEAKWERVQRKARLGDIFQADATGIDDTGLSAYVSAVRQERLNNGNERSVA